MATQALTLTQLSLGDAERELCAAAKNARSVRFGRSDRIRAEVVRRLLLGQAVDGRKYALTRVGIRIIGGTIEGRLELDNAVMPDGGPIAALELNNCLLDGGFSGVHAHFSRLSFNHCRFRRPLARRGRPVPTIDLSGSTLDTDLAMRAIRPAPNETLLWIRARGARIDGLLDLSRSQLHGPRDSPDRLISEPGTDALDLTGAEIAGDFAFVNRSRSTGRIVARRVQIKGDVWMSGATLEAHDWDEQPYPDALFFQGATIDGLMMLDGRPDDVGKQGEMQPFKCYGGLNLSAAEIGRDLAFNYSVVNGPARFVDLTVKNDLMFGALVDGDVDLRGCRIGGSLDLSDLALGQSSTGMDLADGRIGRSLRVIQSHGRELPRYELIAGRHAMLRCLPGVELVETLWQYEFTPDRPEPVQVGFLVKGDLVLRLDGHAALLGVAAERFGHDIADADAAEEYLRLYCAYTQDGHGASLIPWGKGGEIPPFLLDSKRRAKPRGLSVKPISSKVGSAPGSFALRARVLHGDHMYLRDFVVAAAGKKVVTKVVGETRCRPLLTGMPRFERALIRHPVVESTGADSTAGDPPWVTPQTVAKMEIFAASELQDRRDEFSRHMLANVSLRGKVDLENLSCDMLDDLAGRYWGRQVRIEMNHFVYNLTTWEKDPEETSEKALVRLWQGFVSQLRRTAARTLPVKLTDSLRLTDRLRQEDPPLPWQTRLNWIYQQFDTSGVADPTKYTIRQSEYRPQPFEQAIKVARAEGREDYAIEFEIEKRNIEWRLFSRRNRGWFMLVGAGGAGLWLVLPRDDFTRETMLAAVFLFAALTLISDIFHVAMNGLFGHLRKPIRAIGTLVAAFLLGWAGVDAANDRGMLVIDVEPVASLVGEETGKGDLAILGTQKVLKGNLANKLPCGTTINEALYALDVLVPLIDLREESRCEVGKADERSGHPYRSGGLLGLIESWIGEPTTLWAVLKAFYAILGWFIVSLAILTFVQITRSRSEPA
jgi:hypothetical protein